MQTLDFDLSLFLIGKDITDRVEKGCAEQYYNLDAINIVQS